MRKLSWLLIICSLAINGYLLYVNEIKSKPKVYDYDAIRDSLAIITGTVTGTNSFVFGYNTTSVGTNSSIGAYGKMYTDMNELKREDSLVKANPSNLIWILEKNEKE